MMMDGRVGAVIIGRNEGERLLRCLESVRQAIPHVVYVDSGSRDGSPEAAERRGAAVVRLTSGPFTAARGRQEGLDHLKRHHASLQYVQFIDGDCILRDGWVETATAALDADPRLAGVSGRRREEHADTSLFSQLIDVDWDVPPGPANYVGGDSLMRVAAIDEAGGWPVELIAGEEPDLCFRIRDLGWSVSRIPAEQTLHDVAMTRIRQYWRRAVRSGHSYVEVAARRWRGSGRYWAKRVVTTLAYGIGLPLVALATATLLPRTVALVVIGAIVLLYVRQLVSRVRYCRRRGRSWRIASIYSTMELLGTVGASVGILGFLVSRTAGRRRALIEYKQVSNAPTA